MRSKRQCLRRVLVDTEDSRLHHPKCRPSGETKTSVGTLALVEDLIALPARHVNDTLANNGQHAAHGNRILKGEE